MRSMHQYAANKNVFRNYTVAGGTSRMDNLWYFGTRCHNSNVLVFDICLMRYSHVFVCFITGEDDREKSGPQDQQLSPFHKITLPHSTDLSEHTVGVGSPQAAVPKIKKPAMMCNSTGVRDGCGCQAPATRGRRAKNRGRKKTSQTTTSSGLETDALSVTVDGQVLDGTTSADDKTVSEKKDLVSGVAVSEKKDLVCVVVDGSDEGDDKSSEAVAEDSDLSVSSRTHLTDVTSDVEQKQPSRDAVVGRRCTSVPAAKSRYSISARLNTNSRNFS